MKNKKFILPILCGLLLCSCDSFNFNFDELDNNEKENGEEKENTHDTELTTYTITFNTGGGTLIPNQYIIEGGTIIEPDKPTKNGYDFAGWQFYRNGTSIGIAENAWANFTVDSDIEFIANWEEIRYSIFYDFQDGFSENDYSSYYTINSDIILPEPTKQGFSFAGWYKGETLFTQNYSGLTGDINLTAHWTVNSYRVSIEFDNKKGTVDGAGSYSYGATVGLLVYENPGYKFAGWYKKDQYICDSDPFSFKVDGDVTYEARFNAIDYSITYVLDGGTNNPNNPSKYNKDVTSKLFEPTKEGYSFKGWYYQNNLISSITEGFIGDITLTASWSPNVCNVSLLSNDLSKGSASFTGTNTYGSSITLSAHPYDGYKFDGWYDGDTFLSTDNPYTFIIKSAISYTAKFIPIEYDIIYNLDGGTNNPNNPSKITTENSVTLLNPTKEGYSFVGWYSNGNKISSISKGTTSSITLNAQWSANPYTLTVTSNDPSNGTVGGGGVYYAGNTVTLSATYTGSTIVDQYASTKPGFSGWYFDGVCVSTDSTYSFEMPGKDVTIVGKFDGKPKTLGDTMLFGSYPQSQVTDTSIISELNGLVSDLPTTSDNKNWTKYDWYVDSKNADVAAWYIDLDTNNDNQNDYRGVYFTSSYNSNQSDNGFNPSTLYWFKYDPIRWKFLSDSLILCANIIDCCSYSIKTVSEVHEKTDYQGNQSITGDNNYQYSYVRELLNVDLYNTAFNSEESKKIDTTLVDNVLYEVSIRSDLCDNTQDKIFILSRFEYVDSKYNFDNNSTNRMSYTTDYAACLGGYRVDDEYAACRNCGFFWSRSQDSYDTHSVYYANPMGYIYDVVDCYVAYGVIPALNLK